VSVWRLEAPQVCSSLRVFTRTDDDLVPVSLQLASVAVLAESTSPGRHTVVVDDALDWDRGVLTLQSGGVIRLCFGTVAREPVLDHPSINTATPWTEQCRVRWCPCVWAAATVL
jgi:hypothetical protein